MNGLKVKNRTDGWRLSTELQILKSKVLGMYGHTYLLPLEVVLFVLALRTKAGGKLMTILFLIWHPRVSVLNGSEYLLAV